MSHTRQTQHEIRGGFQRTVQWVCEKRHRTVENAIDTNIQNQTGCPADRGVAMETASRVAVETGPGAAIESGPGVAMETEPVVAMDESGVVMDTGPGVAVQPFQMNSGSAVDDVIPEDVMEGSGGAPPEPAPPRRPLVRAPCCALVAVRLALLVVVMIVAGLGTSELSHVEMGKELKELREELRELREELREGDAALTFDVKNVEQKLRFLTRSEGT